MTLRSGLGATYRIQLRRELSFTDAAAVVPYLARLGIETLYCSPIAEAVPGSTHGYDGTEPTRLRAELGGEPGYDALVQACEASGLGICVDIVPNHLATWPGGPWWRRLLAEGPDSELAPVFDIAWDAGGTRGKVTLPLLDRPLDRALDDGTVSLAERDGAPVLVVGEADLPVAGGRPREGERAADVLAAQHYRLADWHDAADRNYRRFFDVDGLVGVRVETPEVFARTHSLVGELACSRRLSAVRVDHVDGLREPTTYLRRLAALTGVPIVVEKILSGDEALHPSWPVRGATGYEAIDDVGGVLVEPDGFDRLVAQARAGGEPAPSQVTVEARRFVADGRFPGEVRRLAGLLALAPGDLVATASRLTRYRTYLDDAPPRPVDAAEWRGAADRAGTPGVAEAVLDPDGRAAALELQQLTGAIMAKGVEDTAWYRLAGPLAFCEVGGEPARDRHDACARLHDRAAERAAAGRGGLLPGTTHDTKRALDVRCRLYALSEVPERFAEGLVALRRRLDLPDDGGDVACETRFLAQLLLGVEPTARAVGATVDGAPLADAGGAGDGRLDDRLDDRLGGVLAKSAREAKVRSSWTEPDEAYEERLIALGDRALAGGAALLHESFGPLVADVARLGAVNSLSSTVLRSALPGVPDCYQGDETWDLSLVDPDNRRPVDFARLAAALQGVEDLIDGAGLAGLAGLAELRRGWADGRLKLFVTARCLHARRRAGSALDPGAPHLPLTAEGPTAGNLVAFARRGSETPAWVVAVVTRLASGLPTPVGDLPSGRSYADTRLVLPEGAPDRFTDVLSGTEHRARDGGLAVQDVLGHLPVALLLGG